MDTRDRNILIGVIIGVLLIGGIIWVATDNDSNDIDDENGQSATVTGEADIEEIAVTKTMNPLAVRVVAKGNLNDACTTIGTIEQSRDDKKIEVKITTTRPRDMQCAQVLTPFERSITLSTQGLSTGEYTVEVNDVEEDFIIAAGENTATPPPSPNPSPSPSPTPPATPPPSSSSLMRFGANGLFVVDQKPGSSVFVHLMYLDRLGFLTIHINANGEPGELLGTSALLPRGDSANFKVILKSAIRDGDELIAVLHKDNGDKKFDVAKDPIIDDDFGPIMAEFFVDAKAEMPSEIAI